jgi:hypothetical protein
MALTYPPFKASVALNEAARNNPPLRSGSRGTAVALVQGALVQLGYKLPRTMSKGFPDGSYGSETVAAVTAFQTKSKIKVDGSAGEQTITALDRAMVAASPVAPPTPVPTPPSPPGHYKLGTTDPAIGADPGAGKWGAKSSEATYIALKLAIIQILPQSIVLVGDDAAKHMSHYLGNSGRAVTIDLEGMIDEVPSAKLRFQTEVAQAKSFVESLPVGRHQITSTKPEVGYNRKSENTNWFFAIGGYSTWGKGTAIVSADAAGRRSYSIDYEYKFYDRYNWDAGKSVTLFGITITDAFMAEFHRQGLAQEFDCHGACKRSLAWKHGQAIPPAQLEAPGGRS